MASAALFAPVAKHRVTASTPVRDGGGLDVERCAALHNTLMLYGWVCGGKKIPEMVRKSWWSRYGSQPLQKVLHPGTVRYLQKIFDVQGHNFFYHLTGLSRPIEMLRLGDVLEDEDHDPDKVEKYRFLVLYSTSPALVTHPAGIVYDQITQNAILMPTYNHVFDLRNRDLPWQRLEVILSAFFDMIEAEKAMAVHENFARDASIKGNELAPQIDVQRANANTMPWLLQPFTTKDLQACIAAWKKIVETLEKRAGIVNTEPLRPIASNSALNAAKIPHGFAFELLRHAQASEISFVAPGVRLPKTDEFVHQPFKAIVDKYPKETAGMKMPFLFLRCPGTVSGKESKFRWPFSTLENVPCGLYLDAFPNAQNPFEDACRLVLPIQLGANKYARTSDFRPIRKSYSELYQIDINPFVMRHGPKLVAILENWYENIENGHWSCNEKGVSGGIGMWRKADTRDDWWRYQSKHLYL